MKICRMMLAGLIAWSLSGTAATAGWKAGSARTEITPKQPLWMAGYAARKGPSEGTLHPLWARALVLEGDGGGRAVLVTLDLCGIDRAFSNQVRDALQARHSLGREQITLACSHTHTGPVVGTNLITMYPLDDEQYQRIKEYTAWLHGAIVETVGRAIAALKPAELAWGTGRAEFAVNRRNNPAGQVVALRRKGMLKGPVDHDVPVLRVASPEGQLRAIVCSYACHCTTLSFNQFSNDYAGFAQIELEQAHPDALSLFVAGCGADQNPLPRGTIEHARGYGKDLADAVEHVLSQEMTPIVGSLRMAYREIDLAFAPPPDRAFWEAEAQSANFMHANRARHMLKRLDADGKLPTSHPYPVQAWRLGDGPTWVLLGGEVVVDYALRLKRELGTPRTWVASYCNDVMAYIPSLRVLKEGGYEGATAMVPYGQPASWSERVEDDVVAAVRAVVEQTKP